MPFAVIQSRQSSAEMMATLRRASRFIVRRKCKHTKLRARLERDAEGWLLHYGGKAMFPYPFSDGHKAIIRETIAAAKTGTGSAVAAPRGEGKTTIMRAIAVYLVAVGVVRFPVLVGWKHGDAKEALKTWLRMFTEGKAFREDYPELCQPFEHSTHATALKNLAWRDTEQITGAMTDNSGKLITLPDSRGAIACRSAQGDAKGLNAIMPDGTVLRPDFVLFDDAQDPRCADKPDMVQKTVDVLENVFLGMAGPQKRLTAAAACTVEAIGDVSEHWLTRPGWKSLRISRITTWPGGGDGGDWPDTKRPEIALWDEWNRVRLDEGEAAAIAHYLAHKAELTAGMTVSWSERYDKKRGDPDALYAAMWDRYNMGAVVFAKAQQNRPLKQGVTLYTLTPDVILSRMDQREPGQVPEFSRMRIAATDVNQSYGLTWGLLGFGADQTAGVIGYGIHPMSVPRGATQAEAHRAVFENLVAHGKYLAALPCRPEHWFADASGSMFDAVLAFAARSVQLCGLQCTPCTGRGARNYRPYGKSVLGKPREGCHMAVDLRGRKWVAYNADYWREQAQKAWTGSVGAPGSCSLPRGQHREFAEQVCREQLRGKSEIAGQMVWIWDTLPGAHDYGDVMTMCYMGAAWGGIGSSGVQEQPKAATKARAVIFRPSNAWRNR